MAIKEDSFLNLEGSYINGEKIAYSNTIGELDENDAFDSLVNFINTYRNDIKILNILQCAGASGNSYLGPNLNGLISNCSNLTEVHIIENEYWSSNIRMDNMFYKCVNLTTITMPNWTMSNVTNMDSMFYLCSNLTSLDVSNWNVSNVTNMYGMFFLCSNLTSLDVSNWNMSSVTNVSDMFYLCSNLISLNVSNWNVSNVTNMRMMFGYCNNSLTSLDVSNWNVSNVTNMYGVFYDCEKLTSLDVSNWNVSNVTNMYGMFAYSRNLKTIYINPNNWQLNTSLKSTNMFSGCYNLYGRKGTAYVNSKVDASYARIDGGPDLPGYFCGVYNMAVGNIPIKDAYFRGQKVNKAILGRDLLNLKKN